MTASAEALIQAYNPPYTYGSPRYHEFALLIRDTIETFRAELSQPQWEREIYGFDPGTLPRNSLVTRSIMALLRAHQWNNPAKLINVIAPTSIEEHNLRYTLSGFDLEIRNLPKPFQDAIEQATTTGVFWTQAIQLSNIIARLQGLPPLEVYKRTLSAITQSYKNPHFEIDLKAQPQISIAVFPVRNILRLANVYLHLVSGLQIGVDPNMGKGYSRYGHGIRTWQCLTSTDRLPIIPPFREVLSKIILDAVSMLIDSTF